MLLKALLIGLVGAWGYIENQFGTLYSGRPIVLGPLVGLILGDLQTGLVIGATLELMFMGAISIGAYIPPDVNVGGVLATAFAITLGQSVEAAVTLAMPIAVVSLGLRNFVFAVTPVFLKIGDEGAREGNVKKIYLCHWLMGFFLILEPFTLCFLGYYLGAEAVTSLLNSIPQFILDGMGLAAGILPAIGFAMLLRMILSKELVPFFFLGFMLSSYLQVPVLGIALIAIIIVIEKFDLLNTQPKSEVALEGADDSEEF